MILFKGQELLSKQEFADKIDVSYNTVTSMIDRGLLEPVAKFEKREFFSNEQVDAYWRGEYVPIRKSGDSNGNSKD